MRSDQKFSIDNQLNHHDLSLYNSVRPGCGGTWCERFHLLSQNKCGCFVFLPFKTFMKRKVALETNNLEIKCVSLKSQNITLQCKIYHRIIYVIINLNFVVMIIWELAPSKNVRTLKCTKQITKILRTYYDL